MPSYISDSSRRSPRSGTHKPYVSDRPSSTMSRSSTRSSRNGSRYEDVNDSVHPSESSSNIGSRMRRDSSDIGSRDSGSSRSYTGVSGTSSSSQSRASGGTTTSRGFRLPNIVEVEPTEFDYSMSDEEYILSQWESQKPTSTFGTRYGERPSSQYLGLADQNSSAFLRPSSNLCSSRGSRSSRTGPPPSSSSCSRYDSDSNDGRSRMSSSSKRSSYSASGNRSSHHGNESIEHRLNQLSLGSKRSCCADDEDSEAELRIPDSYRGGSSVAGASASRYSRHSRSSRY